MNPYLVDIYKNILERGLKPIVYRSLYFPVYKAVFEKPVDWSPFDDNLTIYLYPQSITDYTISEVHRINKWRKVK